MRYFLLVFGVIVITVMVVAGKRGDMSRRPPIELFPDMDRQPKLRPQTANSFFKDGLSSQQPIDGAIARGSAYQDTPENTGKIPSTTNWVQTIPAPVTAQVMARGRERYDISCAPCHGAQGDGKGITTQYGMPPVANFHDPRFINLTDGDMFNTITHGKNLMGAYAAQVTPEDRWAVIAYVRALQRSRLVFAEELTPDLRAKLPNAPPAQ